MDIGALTVTQRKIYQLLSDGRHHSREELATSLWDELANPRTVEYHISVMRATLSRHHESILWDKMAQGYILVRRLKSAVDGKS